MKTIPTLREKDFLAFYQQSGGSIPIFIAKRQRQYGSGLGSFLFKTVLPFLGKTIKKTVLPTLGKTVKKTVLPAALSAAEGVISDISKGEDARATLKKRGLQVGTQIARNILSTPKRTSNTGPPPLKRRRVAKAKKKKKNRKGIKRKKAKDIFSV